MYAWPHKRSSIHEVSTDEHVFIKRKKESLWSEIQISTNRYKTLSTQEEQIKKYFEEIFNFFMAQEFSKKREIRKEKKIMKRHINNKIDELKEIVKILEINNVINSTNNSINSERVKSTNVVDNLSDISETHVSTIETLTKSISDSKSLFSFIKSNRETLFYVDQIEIDQLRSQHNNDLLLLLDSLLKYNTKFKATEPLKNNNNNNNNNINNNINDQHIYNEFKVDHPTINNMLLQSLVWTIKIFDQLRCHTRYCTHIAKQFSLIGQDSQDKEHINARFARKRLANSLPENNICQNGYVGGSLWQPTSDNT
ncbi:hypothetical protein PPL_08284 [Heterostelium album PN500]|uniref:Uncharacterized protein n=1 Tax=Heterostelium pallidum (strain ATCC 26659 / Pp 5 / PN500) TaxID=670386 RepID=D3BHS0_HETP5|nr:hypothetical protein PPL_08284 [Heterostelium album PN500]EFA78820.1 hypothetical protein PPL_08284 [Heterostelium album PN500]|eukprot:XP_020430944.1 hypothetical protein PPL_08284 [Heterostelium album PN500]